MTRDNHRRIYWFMLRNFSSFKCKLKLLLHFLRTNTLLYFVVVSSLQFLCFSDSKSFLFLFLFERFISVLKLIQCWQFLHCDTKICSVALFSIRTQAALLVQAFFCPRQVCSWKSADSDTSTNTMGRVRYRSCQKMQHGLYSSTGEGRMWSHSSVIRTVSRWKWWMNQTRVKLSTFSDTLSLSQCCRLLWWSFSKLGSVRERTCSLCSVLFSWNFLTQHFIHC